MGHLLKGLKSNLARSQTSPTGLHHSSGSLKNPPCPGDRPWPQAVASRSTETGTYMHAAHGKLYYPSMTQAPPGLPGVVWKRTHPSL